MKRERFFGLHIDLHPTTKETRLGEKVSVEMVEKLIRVGRPDFIQYDCKGHPGVLGYPSSAVSTSAAMGGDSLKIYREVTRRHGIDLLVHFSGVWDDQACADRPEWKYLQSDGLPGKENYTSLFSSYVVDRMIPQMKEVVDRYDVDGFWVDGECWGVQYDYCAEALAHFKKKTGQSAAPKSPQDPFWKEWGDVHRDQYFKYLETWMSALQKYKPALLLVSNWLYTNFSPEPVTRYPVAQLSGDFDPAFSDYAARFSARQMSSTGVPWDLMAWSFVSTHNATGSVSLPKTESQLFHEASVCLPHGGGFQIYINPDRHSEINEYSMKLFEKTADFCHQRRELCFRTVTASEIAVIIDRQTHYHDAAGVFVAHADSMLGGRGSVEAILNSGHSVDVLMDHQMKDQLRKYQTVFVSECTEMLEADLTTLIDYLHAGGSIVLSGATLCARVGKRLHWPTVEVKKLQQQFIYLTNPVRHARFLGEYGLVKRSEIPSMTILLERSIQYVPDSEELTPIVTHHTVGKGKMICAWMDLGTTYANYRQPALREVYELILNQIHSPLAQVIKNPFVELILRTQGDRLLMNLVNSTPLATHSIRQIPGYFSYDALPVLADIRIQIRSAHEPILKLANLEKSLLSAPRRVSDGLWEVVLSKLEYHQIIEMTLL